MAKATMQKWQRDWFVKELDRDYDPLIQAAQLRLPSTPHEAIQNLENNIEQTIDNA